MQLNARDERHLVYYSEVAMGKSIEEGEIFLTNVVCVLLFWQFDKLTIATECRKGIFWQMTLQLDLLSALRPGLG